MSDLKLADIPSHLLFSVIVEKSILILYPCMYSYIDELRFYISVQLFYTLFNKLNNSTLATQLLDLENVVRPTSFKTSFFILCFCSWNLSFK